MTVPISVVIPVGPKQYQSEHLLECLESVNRQTQAPNELVIVDSSGILLPGVMDCPCTSNIVNRPVITIPPTGIPDAFNVGVSYARNELVFLLGSDDRLLPRCLEQCYAAYNRFQQSLAWYFVGVEYSNGFTQNTPCLAAMITKTLWQTAGPLARDGTHNYPGCEVEYISRMLLANGRFGATYRVSDDVLYWHRIHTPGSVGI